MNLPITADELKEILRLHALWLQGDPEGKRASLVRANLDGANLDGANLVRANLVRANLDGANLDGANLVRANLVGANLDGANLVRANLVGANLVRANLDGANLYEANLYEANLQGATTGDNKHLFIAGQDMRGWIFYGWRNLEGTVVVKAGCREFISITAARAHWQSRHADDHNLHTDCLALVDRCEWMARVRGWKLEIEKPVSEVAANAES